MRRGFRTSGELSPALHLSGFPAKAGTYLSAALPLDRWIPAFVGMTDWGLVWWFWKPGPDLRPHGSANRAMLSS